ncbi:pyrroline-5-carboxylate reductase [Sphingomonas sp. JC676]|uniref:pyrroline-5-carboxylate reductase n=1 Tax=Sphingomonas sp. JC676 TaxID=2768065 RepID=UPI0016579EC1|nr:pyrroline-5-carboxylate reductase [Sphingomonas sp. JC676]MBC9033750.1 pyrroline-5-carboxylate reductase [Sphingomonas sp. JC676]
MDQYNIILFGGGRMGSALLRGWLAAGVNACDINVVDPAPLPELAELACACGFALNAPIEAQGGQALVLAVKPQKIAELAAQYEGMASEDTLIVSIIAGKTLADLARLFPQARSFVRAMPNLPAAVGRGATVAATSGDFTPAHRLFTERLLGSTGTLEWLGEEDLIDAATGVSGSGPAYFFYLCDCLTEAGLAAGLPYPIAERLARQTIAGAGEMLRVSEKSAEQLRRDVTSPAGTTEAGLKVLMADGLVPGLIERAVATATARARELAG